ncbi:MAG TPA: hypothetical protein VIR16_03415 [Candidatus Limnocylindrales bacterium]
MLSGDTLAASLTQGGASWMVASVAAVLPILWAFTLSLHFARPYVLRFLQSLTLRFGGDVWWLSYVLTRDALLVITLVLSTIFLFPDVYLRGDGLGITAPIATLFLMWAALVKLVGDPDDKASHFQLQSILLLVASVLYIVPQIYGMEAADQGLSWTSALTSMTTVTKNGVDVSVPQPMAEPILWGTLILIGITGGLVFVRFLLKLGTNEAGEASALAEA